MTHNISVAVFIHTFLRDDQMRRCVDSVREHLPGARIYLSDGGDMTTEKKKYYDKLEAEGHWVRHYEEYNPWWRKIFNEKAKIATEDYIMKVDDDFYFTQASKLNLLPMAINNLNGVLLLGGRVYHDHRKEFSPYTYKITGMQDDKYVLDTVIVPDRAFAAVDFVPDFWIARSWLFDHVQMDPDLKPAQGGHEKFFIDIYEARKAGKIGGVVGYTTYVTAYHDRGTQSAEYKRERSAGMNDYKNMSRVIKSAIK
jgi:hypothetical protein